MPLNDEDVEEIRQAVTTMFPEIADALRALVKAAFNRTDYSDHAKYGGVMAAMVNVAAEQIHFASKDTQHALGGAELYCTQVVEAVLELDRAGTPRKHQLPQPHKTEGTTH